MHSLVGGRRDSMAKRLSDRSRKLGERGGDAQRVWGVGGEFVVAAAEVLGHEVHPRPDRRCRMSSSPTDLMLAYRSRAFFGAAEPAPCYGEK